MEEEKEEAKEEEEEEEEEEGDGDEHVFEHGGWNIRVAFLAAFTAGLRTRHWAPAEEQLGRFRRFGEPAALSLSPVHPFLSFALAPATLLLPSPRRPLPFATRHVVERALPARLETPPTPTQGHSLHGWRNRELGGQWRASRSLAAVTSVPLANRGDHCQLGDPFHDPFGLSPI